MAKKKAAKKKTPAKKNTPAKKKVTKVIDEPIKQVFYKQGELIDGFEILEEAADRSKKKDPMPFDLQWETQDSIVILHILGAISLEKKKK
jgi:hypothetical protein